MKAYRIVCDNPSGPIKIYDPDGKEVKNIVSLEILPITCGDTVRCCFETFATLDIKAEKFDVIGDENIGGESRRVINADADK